MNQASTSLWQATAQPSPFPSLTGELEADVAIVGAGITGLTAAVLLAERGRSVIVVEKERVASGESGNTTAHLTEAVDARYHYLRRHYSKEEARQVAEASRASIEKIYELHRNYNIDCKFRRVPGYLYTEKRKYVGELKNEARAAAESGLEASFVTSVPLPFATRGAVLFANQAQFHPVEYFRGLAGAATKLGVRIFENSQAVDVKKGLVECEGGRVRARHVFMATNVPVAGFTHVHTMAAAYRSYALAFRVDGDHPDGLFWDTADPYHYTRWQETDEGTFLIIGGEDHRVGEESDTEACFARLLEYSRSLFGVGEPQYRWSGQIIEPHGGLPLIGGSSEDVYISTGYAGQGMTFGTVGAMLVADLITGVENPWRELFHHQRVVPHMTAKEFLTENAKFPAHLIADRLTPADDEASDVARGEGKIIERDGRKVAAYRDDGGVLHCVSAVCTHMKCDVAWNGAERTWDCPCHGSRFTTEGAVLNGPAREPLEKIS